uniref:C-X-C motif chemokine n=1 Tax=Zonotrichia albicollis TaxID=44394 RepID=A0A8D2QBQ1_ZONAL
PAPAMNPYLSLLLAAAALCQGAPLAGELRCRCVRTVSEVIPPRRLARLEFLAEGPHCAVPEVIATTKKGLTICLDPVAPWVKLLDTIAQLSSFDGFVDLMFYVSFPLLIVVIA